MPNKTTTVGVVGLGYWGPKLVRNFSELAEAELAWVADLDPARLDRVKSQYPAVRTTTNVEELLRSDVDAVIFATPIRTHYRLARAALQHGKHVLVEKPLAASSEEASDLLKLAEATGRILMVGHTFEFNPAIRALREIVASGELGEIYYVNAARLNLGLFQPDINVIWDLAPHDFSILLYVLQSDPIAISARGSAHIQPGVHDVVYIELRFPDDVMANVQLSWLDPCKVRRITIVGSRKMVVCDDLQELEKIRIYDKGVEHPYETDQFRDFHLAYRNGGVRIPFIPLEEPLQNQCAHFVRCIQTNARPQTDGRVGLKVVRMIEQADKSLHHDGRYELLAAEPGATAAEKSMRYLNSSAIAGVPAGR